MHEDHRYIEALRRSDPAAIREIYTRFAPQAIRWVTRNNGTVADAQDVFQEALMALYEKARQPDFVLSCPLGGLLHVLWTRKWIDRLRQKGRETVVRKMEDLRYSSDFDTDALALAEDALQEASENALLAKAFAQLSELCRQLLTALGQGIAPREVAQQLAMNSVDTLYRRKNACAERWRALVKEGR